MEPKRRSNMEPNKFIKEVYERMGQVSKDKSNNTIKYEDFINSDTARSAAYHYKSLLPSNYNARILDIGYGNGWFMAACVRLGYTNIYGADFGGKKRMKGVVESTNSIKEVYDITDNIGDFLSENGEKYDFIHFSHVIEHIPKYSLFHILDSIYNALSSNGVLLVRTPNMEGPLALSSFYITLGHEYGFSASNLQSLLSICKFNNIEFHDFPNFEPTIKVRIGNILRGAFILLTKFKYRLFGATGENFYNQFGIELIVSVRRS